jgi:hypothetical protein
MRRIQRIVMLAAFVAVLPVLAGCADFDMDKLDVFGLTDKKKLPGDRKPVFPEGVPGVTQGVPPQYIKGNQPAPEAALVPPVEAAPPPVEEPKPKPKRKVAAKPRPVAAAPVQPVSQEPQQAAPQQANPQQAWPQGSTPAPSSGGTAAWPAPQPSGTFSR